MMTTNSMVEQIIAHVFEGTDMSDYKLDLSEMPDRIVLNNGVLEFTIRLWNVNQKRATYSLFAYNTFKNDSREVEEGVVNFTGAVAEAKQPSMIVNEETAEYIVYQVFGNDMPNHRKTVFGNKIVLDGVTKMYIEVEKYDDKWHLFLDVDGKWMEVKCGQLEFVVFS